MHSRSPHVCSQWNRPFFYTQPAVQSRRAAFKISTAHFKKKETTIPASLGAAPVDDWVGLTLRIRDVWERLCARAMHKAEWHDDLCATCVKTNPTAQQTDSHFFWGGEILFQRWGGKEVTAGWQQLQKQQNLLLKVWRSSFVLNFFSRFYFWTHLLFWEKTKKWFAAQFQSFLTADDVKKRI